MRASNWHRSISRAGRLLCVVLAAVTLAGCVVVPARPWHPYPRYYY